MNSQPFHFQDCEARAMSRYVEQQLIKLYRVWGRDGLWENFPVELTGRQRELITQSYDISSAASSAQGVARNAMLITFNLDGLEWDTYTQIFDRLCSYKNLITDVQAVLEQRSDNPEEPYGYHMHVLVTPLKNKAEILKRSHAAAQFILKKLGTQCNLSSVDVKAIPREAGEAYIAGEKATEAKNAKVEVDRMLREQFGHPHIMIPKII